MGHPFPVLGQEKGAVDNATLPTFVSSSTGSSTTTSLVIPKPDGVVAGDLIIFNIAVASAVAVLTTEAALPPGVFLISRELTSQRVWTLAKFVTNSEPASFSFPLNVAATSGGLAIAYRGARDLPASAIFNPTNSTQVSGLAFGAFYATIPLVVAVSTNLNPPTSGVAGTLRGQCVTGVGIFVYELPPLTAGSYSPDVTLIFAASVPRVAFQIRVR